MEQLNAASTAGTELEYNGRVHGQTGQKPVDRWGEAAARVRYATDDELRQAFLFREARTPDKAATPGL